MEVDIKVTILYRDTDSIDSIDSVLDYTTKLNYT